MRIQAEMLVAISAVVIGVCALGISLYETSLMRTEQRAAVMPLLELARSHYGDNDSEDNWHLTIHAENVGIGPARVIDFVVTVDGVPQPTWGNAMRALTGHDGRIRYGLSTINGRTIPADRLITIFDLGDTEFTDDIIAEFDRLGFEACFCSVFDECWKTSYSMFGKAQPVDQCRRSDTSFRE